MEKAVREYWENGFHIDSDTREEVLDFLYDNLEPAPVTMYRGLQIEGLEAGDCISLHDTEAFASATPSKDFAWNFALHGGSILVLPAGTIEGYQLNEDEWIVLNEDVEVARVEHDEVDDVFIVYCE